MGKKGVLMKIELKALSVEDTEKLYDFFQSIPASENGTANKAYGLTKDEFAKWIKTEEGYSTGVGLPEGWIAGTTYILYIDDTPVGRSNLRHSLTPGLEQDGGHIGLAIAPQYRGKGYGKILLLETLKKAKEKNINPALVFNHDDNLPAWKMSESLNGKLERKNFIESKGLYVRKYVFDTSKIASNR